MKKGEDNKDRMYQDRIEKVEGGTFTPLIFTTKGARSYKTAKTITKLAAKITSKRKEKMSDTVKKLSQELSFVFLKSELACIRGTRKKRGYVNSNVNNNTGLIDTL